MSKRLSVRVFTILFFSILCGTLLQIMQNGPFLHFFLHNDPHSLREPFRTVVFCGVYSAWGHIYIVILLLCWGSLRWVTRDRKAFQVENTAGRRMFSVLSLPLGTLATFTVLRVVQTWNLFGKRCAIVEFFGACPPLGDNTVSWDLFSLFHLVVLVLLVSWLAAPFLKCNQSPVSSRLWMAILMGLIMAIGTRCLETCLERVPVGLVQFVGALVFVPALLIHMFRAPKPAS
jgi:hypothetical protein